MIVRTVRLYAIAIAVTLVAVVVAHTTTAEPEISQLMLVVPIVLCTHYFGFKPSIAGTITATIATLLINPTIIDEQSEIIGWFAIVISTLIISTLWARLTTSVQRAEASRLRAEQSERRISESFHASPVPLFVTNLETQQFTEVNDAFVKLIGYRRDELIGHTATELGIMADAAKLARRLRRAGIIRDEAVMLRRKDGELRDVLLALDLATLDGELHGVSTLNDRTDQKRAELALHASADLVRQAQKMDSLGMLAGGIAHDFNNLLAVISTNASLLSESIAQGTEDREMIDDIESTVKRAVALTGQLLAFSRKQVTTPVVLDLNACVNETRKMLRRMIGGDIKLETSLEPDLQNVHIDPSSIVQVLINLVVNGRDAMPRGGTIAIRTRNSGGLVMLSVTDTGSGMRPEIRDRVFEPFFTTKAVGKGTGMGLAVVHGIVQQAGGQIAVESVVDVGTTFTVSFPAAAAEIAESARPKRTTLTNGIETLLVVDDDEHVRRSAARALRSRGYHVIEAHTAVAALRMLDKNAVDLLLTDVVMPQMDGRELAEVAVAAHPALKVLFMSGCVEDVIIRHGVERAEVELIEKPFKTNALASRVRHLLDVGRAAA